MSVVFIATYSLAPKFGDFGGGGRVRTRNTLHIVGARKSSICYNAVERRKRKRDKNDKTNKKRENNNNSKNTIK